MLKILSINDNSGKTNWGIKRNSIFPHISMVIFKAKFVK